MPVVGMVGGGQLARMTAQAAIGLGVTFRVLAEAPGDSAALVTHDVTVGSHLSMRDVSAFAGRCDVVTFDHEHVPGRVLAQLESAGVLVRPGSAALRYTQDKLAMRGAIRRRLGEHPERHAERDRGLRGHPRELSAADHAHDRHPAACQPRDRPGGRLTRRPRGSG